VTGAQTVNTVAIQSHAAEAYQPPQRALLIGDAGPSWVDIAAPIELAAGDSLIVPEDRDAQDSVESLKSLLSQLPEDRPATTRRRSSATAVTRHRSSLRILSSESRLAPSYRT
jgi:hypothetical protein